MNSEITPEQIISNNDYSLQLFTKGATLTLKLMIKVSKFRTDVFQITLNSLKDVQKLQQNFDSLEDFKQFIKDVSNIDINLEKKAVRLLTVTKMKKIIQIASVPLQFLTSIEKKSEDELLEQILGRCSQKKELSGEEVKLFLGNIATYLSQQKKQSKQTLQMRQITLQFRDHQLYLKNLVEVKRTQYHEEESKCYHFIKNMEEQIEKCQQRLSKIQKQQDRLEKEKLDKSQIAEMRVESERINKQVEIIKTKMEKDINVLGQRLEREEKLLEKKELNKTKMEQKIQSPEKNEKIQEKFDLKNWVDPDCPDFNNFYFSGSSIIVKKGANVFGRKKIVGQYTYTATFSKIGSYIQLGVMDILRKKDWNILNFVLYFNNKSCLVGSVGSQKGLGFKEGEKVTVVIDLKQGSIEWRVGSEIRNQEKVEMLKDNSIVWVPYIFLASQDDSVEISEE